MRLIDADAIHFVDLNSDMPQSKIRVYVAFKEKIDRLPTIDPVNRGKWEFEPGFMYCSRCGWLFAYETGIEEEWNYCPNCGAKIVGLEKGDDDESGSEE